jgi:uncharacterized protein YqgC (DUF456 family)
MIPTIGFMVATIGAVICLYVAARCVEIVQRRSTSKAVRIAMYAAFLGAVWGMLKMSMYAEKLTQQEESVELQQRQRGAHPTTPAEPPP